MATLNLNMLTGLFRDSNPKNEDSKVAREFARKAHEKTGGPTSELKRVYGAYLDNERRRKDTQHKG